VDASPQFTAPNYFFLGLAVSLGYGVASEVIRRSATAASDSPPTPAIMTEANVNRLVSKLSQMRGAALKLGQFMSIQGGRCFRLSCRQLFMPSLPPDTHLLPPEVDKIFRRVQDSAHYMPDWQMEASPLLLTKQ
jgi:aarF domain-containing kinase